jgi:hypothetical protein
MRRIAFALLMIAGAVFAAAQARAADSKVTVAPQAEAVVIEPAPHAGAVAAKPAPHVPYGCKRVWRCDKQVCEWRRGCWGIYGYIEGPYYSQELAKRQWTRDGLPVPRDMR